LQLHLTNYENFIGFQNPFYDSGYTNNIKINGLNKINVFIGKNNSGKTYVIRSIYNLLLQDIDRSKIFCRLKIKLETKDFKLLIEKFHKVILKMYKNRNAADHEGVAVVRFHDGEYVNQFYQLFNLMKDYPLSNKCSFILNFNNDIPNNQLLFDYDIDNQDEIYPQLLDQINDIFKKTHSNQDLLRILVNQLIALNSVILLPSFRTLEKSEKKYQDREITEINNLLSTILDKSFHSLPTSNSRSEAFKIPNLALMLSILKENQMSEELKSKLNPEFFELLNSSLKKLFPEIDLSIDFKLTELTTKGGYQEYGNFTGDWEKLGHGTQQLISLIFLLILPRNCIYIIDEPENGLHPGLQLKLLNFIKNLSKNSSYNKQFIFATHSTSFIDFQGDCSHFVCEKSQSKFRIEYLPEENLNIVRDVLGLNPGSLLQANGIIWVEGPSDRNYVKMLFKCFDIDLDQKGVLVIPYYGKDTLIKEYISLDLLNKNNPNFIIIMDSDKKGSKAGYPIDQTKITLKNKFEKAGKNFWLIGKYCDIEGLLPQDVINEYFNIKLPLPKDKIKERYQKLQDYINDIRSQGLINGDPPNYEENKVRNSKNISELILTKKEYRMLLQENIYIAKKIVRLNLEISNWIDLNKPDHEPKNKLEVLDTEARQTILLFNEFLEDLYNSRGANSKDFAIALLNNDKFKKYLLIKPGKRFGKELGDHEIYLLDEKYCIIPNSVTL